MRALEEQGFTLPEPIYRLRFDPEVNTALFSALNGKSAGVTPLASGEDKNDSAATRVKRGDAVLDVTPDKHLEQKVDAEIRSDQGNDLLDKDVPHE